MALSYPSAILILPYEILHELLDNVNFEYIS